MIQKWPQSTKSPDTTQRFNYYTPVANRPSDQCQERPRQSIRTGSSREVSNKAGYIIIILAEVAESHL